MKALTPGQRTALLAALREADCPCGCPMKIAQCRVEDPGCGQSQTLATLALKEAAAGKPAAGIRKALAESPLVKAAAQRDRILLDPVPLPTQGAPSKGPANARVTIVEFSDFQCPFCVKAVGELNAVLKAFPNDVRLVYKQFPLDTHSQAALAARASLAAHEQGKFWELHDRMYAESQAIERRTIINWAKALGLDMPRFLKKLDDPTVQATVRREFEEGSQAGVSATPTIFLNGRKYQGPIEVRLLTPLITAERDKAKGRKG